MRSLVIAATCACAGCNAILGIADLHTSSGTADAALDGSPDGPPAPIHAIALGTDYTNPGTVASFDVRAGTVTKDAVTGAATSDPVVRRYGDEILVIDRYGGDKVVVLDAATLAIKDTFPLPANSNVQDAAAAGSKLYVPALASTGVYVVDRTNKQVKEIPLLQTFDPDGHPDCISVFYTGVRVYVACEVLDASFQPRGAGQIVVIDPFNDTVLRAVPLTYTNPVGFLEPTNPAAPAQGELMIGTVPSFTNFTMGCLEKTKLTDPEAFDGCLVKNDKLGGGANHAEADPTGATIWIASTLYDPNTFAPYGRLVAYDVAQAKLLAPSSQPGEPIVDLAVCPDGYVVASERGSENGVRIFHAGTEGALVDLGRPPVYSDGAVCW